MKKYFYLNGKILPTAKPAIFINDLGLLRGYGVFDFLKTYNGKLFELSEHYKRFVNSAKMLDLKVPVSEKQLAEILSKLLKKNNSRDASFRLLLTPGPSDNGLNFGTDKTTFAVLVEDVYDLPAKLFTHGGKLMTCDYQRMLPESKNLNYIQAVKLQKEKNRKGAIEILYKKEGFITECTTSNFFIFKKGVLITPKDNILGGITRKKVLALAKHFYPIEVRDLTEKEIFTADEAFLTATNKKVLPIVMIDGKKIGSGKVGEETKKLMNLFADYTNNY